ncbi:MAG: 50S ribosomal protein L4 [bacterium]
MTKLPMYDSAGKANGELAVPVEIFGQKMNEAVLHSALVWYLAARRRGTQSTLTKAEVSGGGKKPWKQKGTGRARAGSSRSPLWRTGGVVFAPKPRSYNFRFPKKERKLALKVALSDKAKEGRVIIIDEFKVAEAKTKSAVALLKELKVGGKVLLMLAQENDVFQKAARNINGVMLTLAKDLNVHDLLQSEWVVAEKKAIASLEGVLG